MREDRLVEHPVEQPADHEPAKHAADDQKAYEDYLVARAKSIISESEADARASYRAAVKDAKSTVENAKGVEK